MVKNKYCVLIVDDEVLITRALKDFFLSKEYEVYTAHNGEEALDVYYDNNEKIDVILLDIMMPIMNGMEVLEELQKRGEEVPVLILSAKSQEEDQLVAFHEGAYDYITKPFLPSLLYARVEGILNRMYKRGIETKTVGNIKLDIDANIVYVEDKKIELTKKEFSLLHYFILNENIVLSREKLLDAVWGYQFEGDIRTVDTHVKQLRAKLDTSASYIKTMYRSGYKFEVSE